MTNGVQSVGLVKKAAINHKRISTSYHEAGHIIYALLHLIYIDSAYVIDNSSGDVIGNTDYTTLTIDNFSDVNIIQQLVRFEVGLCYSGQLAEKIHYKKTSGSDTFPLFLREGSSCDTLEAAKLIKKYRLASPGRGRYKYKRKLLKEIELKLIEFWEDVILISHYLFNNKRIALDNIKNILVKESSNNLFWKSHIKNMLDMYKNSDKLDDKDLMIIFQQNKLF